MRFAARVLAFAVVATCAVACGAADDGEAQSIEAESELGAWDPYDHLAAMRNPAKQPSLRLRDRGREDIAWANVDGPLFAPSGPSTDDFVQHSAGDCFFLAAMASLALERPRILRELIDDNGDGTFTVHFHDGVASHANTPDVARPIDVIVDRSLPHSPNGELLYLRLRGARAVWPAILEKAYAKLQGGYQGTTGGFPRNAFLTLTGWDSSVTKLTPVVTRETLYAVIVDALASRHGVVIHTAPGKPDLAGLIGGHAYTVFGARTDARGRLLLGLRNPWGLREPAFDGESDGHDDGAFWMRAVDAVDYFHALTIAGPTVLKNVAVVEPSN